MRTENCSLCGQPLPYSCYPFLFSVVAIHMVHSLTLTGENAVSLSDYQVQGHGHGLICPPLDLFPRLHF